MSNRTSRKSKIIAIPVNRPEGLIRAQMGDEEVKTEAEERDELINEVKAEEEPVTEPLAIEDAPKPKAKRAPRAKAKAEPEPETEAVPFEAPDEPQEAERRAVADKVECPDCGKQMSSKTLRYSHAPNCAAKKKRQEEHRDATPSVTDDMIENEVHKRLTNFREERVARKQKAIQNLIANAF